MDESYQRRFLQAKEVNKLGVEERKAGNYGNAVVFFTRAIDTYPAEPYFFNRSFATLASIDDLPKSSLAADDMFVALLMGYLDHSDMPNEIIVQSLMYYLTKMMQINLINEDFLLKEKSQKVLYRDFILADKYANYANYIQNPGGEYELQVFNWFKSKGFNDAFNSYLSKYAILPFRMELSDNMREQWLSKSRDDTATCLRTPELIQAAQKVVNVLFA